MPRKDGIPGIPADLSGDLPVYPVFITAGVPRLSIPRPPGGLARKVVQITPGKTIHGR
jgi:hypothetical protein